MSLSQIALHRHSLPLSSIDIGERVRQDYGDLPALMASIQKFGLIQPIVVTPEVLPMIQNEANEYDEGRLPKLIAGGRRYFAHAALVELGHLDFSIIDCVYKEALDSSDLREMELEENLQRKDMTWQENCLGVLEIHRIKLTRAAHLGEQWTQAMTGIAIGKTRQRVQQIIPVAQALKDSSDHSQGIWQCKDTLEAMNFLLESQERRAQAILAQRSLGSGQAMSLVDTSKTSSSFTPSGDLAVKYSFAALPSELVSSSNEKPKIKIDLAEYFEHVSCIEWMSREENDDSIDHIITDPPYAIDMRMLEQANTGMDVSSTIEEHQVEENIGLMELFVPEAFDTLKEKGFLVMFCDAMNFKYLHDLGVNCGFSVQRWPVVWCKPSGLNQSAGFNFTKATEFAIVMRKGGSTLVEHQPLNWRCIAKSQADKDFDHPFAKPQELWTWMIEAVSSPGQVVLEPFAGSGSGVNALIKTGRQWRACEKAQQHVMEFLRNISKAYQDRFAANKVDVEVVYNPKAQ